MTYDLPMLVSLARLSRSLASETIPMLHPHYVYKKRFFTQLAVTTAWSTHPSQYFRLQLGNGVNVQISFRSAHLRAVFACVNLMQRAEIELCACA